MVVVLLHLVHYDLLLRKTKKYKNDSFITKPYSYYHHLLQNATDITKIDVIRKCICRQYEHDLPYTYPEWMLFIGYNKKEAKYNQVNLHANYFMYELNENNLETPGINLIIWKNTSSSFFGLTYAKRYT